MPTVRNGQFCTLILAGALGYCLSAIERQPRFDVSAEQFLKPPDDFFMGHHFLSGKQALCFIHTFEHTATHGDQTAQK
jgi:hypothetical protein